MKQHIIFFRCLILLIFFLTCKDISGQENYKINADTVWIELFGLNFKDTSIIHGIDSLILKYNLRKERTKDYFYLLSIENETSNIFYISLMPKYVIEDTNILGFFRIKEQPFIVQGKSIPSLFFKTNYKECFYSRREWVEIKGKTQRWDTFGIEEFTLWAFSYKDGKLSIIEEYFNPLNPSGEN